MIVNKRKEGGRERYVFQFFWLALLRRLLIATGSDVLYGKTVNWRMFCVM
jgi:hypothetical protein